MPPLMKFYNLLKSIMFFCYLQEKEL